MRHHSPQLHRHRLADEMVYENPKTRLVLRLKRLILANLKLLKLQQM